MSPWLTVNQAADYCGCSTRTLKRAVAAGRLRHVRLAGNLRLRFRREWLDAWLLGEAPEATSGGQPRTEAGKSAPIDHAAGQMTGRVQ